jgi:iron complex outermembrane receptor protein
MYNSFSKMQIIIYLKDHLKTFKVILFLIIAFSTAIFPNYKGTISGIVLDRETSEPIPNAVIEILDHDSFFTTNTDGTFEISNLEEGIYRIKFSHIAYKENVVDLSVSESSDKTLRIFLVLKSIEINPVVVTDKLYNSKFEEINEESSVLKGKELQRELGFNLAATLKNETGLAIRSMGPAPARPVIRGLGGNRVLISEDDNVTTDLSSTSPDHAVTIEPFSIDQIEVVRGPKVLLFTPTTIGGVVNVVKNEIPEQIQHQVHGNFGLFGESANNGYLGSVTAEIPFAPVSARFELSRRKADDLKTPVRTLRNSYADNLNGSIGGSFFTDLGFIGGSWRRFELTYGVPGGFVGAHPNGVRIEMFRDQYNAKAQINLNDKTFQNIEAHYSRVLYRHKEFEYSGRIGSEFRIINHLGYVNLNHKTFSLFNNGTVGTSFEFRDFTIGGFVFTPPTKSLNISTYIFESFSLNNFSFEFGARYNFDKIKPNKEKPNSNIGYIRKRTFNTYSLSFSVLYPVSDVVYFGANISKSSRVPTIEELFSEGPHLAAYSFEIGNPDLKAESGIGTEFFVYHKFDSFFYNLVFFRNDLSNYIIPRNTGKINYATFLPVYASNGVSALLYGVESQIEWNITKDFSFCINTSYTRGKFKGTSNSLPQIPPLKGNIGLKYSTDNLVIGFNSELTADQKKTDIFEEPTAGYATMNAFCQYTFLTGNLIHTLSISIDNIFNKEYRNHLSRVKSILPEAGRNFRLTYKLYF